MALYENQWYLKYPSLSSKFGTPPCNYLSNTKVPEAVKYKKEQNLLGMQKHYAIFTPEVVQAFIGGCISLEPIFVGI